MTKIPGTVPNAVQGNYKVADMSLADWGRKEIQRTEQNLNPRNAS